MLPTGKVASTAGTHLDFFQGTVSEPITHRKMGENWKDGVDHNLMFTPAVVETEPRVVLTSPDGGISLRFRTNQSSVQCYTGGGLNGSVTRKGPHKNEEGTGYEKFGAVVRCA